jgi:serine/threonine protein phosphatase PrpC
LLLDELEMQFSSTSVRVAGLTDVGLARQKNDDSFIVADLNPDAPPSSTRVVCRNEGVLLAVADGMGGHAHGDVASTIAIIELTNAMKRLKGRTPDRVRRAVEQAHRAVREAAAGRSGFARMGTTLTAVHVDGKHAHIAQVGDSRAYLVRAGKIARLTVDQTMTEMMIEAGLLDESERELSPWTHQLAQAIGQVEKRLTVATSTLDLREGDVLLVCSDGLTNLVPEADIEETVRSGGPFEETCRHLIDTANLRGGDDNSTVVIAGVRGSLPKPSPHEPLASTHHIFQAFHSPALLRAIAG